MATQHFCKFLKKRIRVGDKKLEQVTDKPAKEGVFRRTVAGERPHESHRAIRGYYSYTTGFVPDPKVKRFSERQQELIDRASVDLDCTFDALVEDGRIAEAEWLIENCENFNENWQKNKRAKRVFKHVSQIES